MTPRVVVLSEPHPYHASGKYGGHHYADVFARHGWQVLLLSATFHCGRLALPFRGIEAECLDLWRRGGKTVAPGILNASLAHLLPGGLRLAKPLRRVSPRLYLPSPESLLRRLGVACAGLLWLNGNEDWLLRRAVPHDKLVVRIIDNYEGFNAGYRNFHPLMEETLRAADGAFACSHYVRDLYRPLRDDLAVVPNGVDWDRFAQPGLPEPEVLRGIPRPRAVYVGAVAEWFDWDLLCALAGRLPGVQFVVVGPWSRPRPARGSHPANVHVTGPVPYAAVPSVLAHCQVGLILFRLSDLVRGVSPIKAYEYLAAGLPVVALRWPELEIENLPVTLATGAEEFARGIEAALSATAAEREARQRFACGCTWEERLKKALELVGVSLC